MALLASLTGTLLAQDAQPRRILFINVHVFDGKSERRIENAQVLVEGNVIKQVSTEKIAAANATVIDGGGRTHDYAELLKLCGSRDPYPGEPGAVEQGALRLKATS
jgi:hypothetical protein